MPSRIQIRTPTARRRDALLLSRPARGRAGSAGRGVRPRCQIDDLRPSEGQQGADTRTDPGHLRAARAWFASGYAPAIGKLLRGSRKGGKLTEAGMSERVITQRVADLGVQIGVEDYQRTISGIHGRSARRATRPTPSTCAMQAAGIASPCRAAMLKSRKSRTRA